MKRSAFKRKAPKASTVIPPEVRAAVVRRDGERCQATAVWEHVCWGGPQLHHRRPRGQGGPHTVDNLITLCAKAHQYVEEHRAWAREHDLLR